MTAERKPITKKTRFEVFKRDKFTCQYCGRSAPEVILEIDHINPVSKGGNNDIMNLVTSCKECNLGKSDRTLSDNSAVKKQQKQIQELAEKNEQLKMMLQWRDGLKKIRESEIDAFENALSGYFGQAFGLSERGRKKVNKALNDYSILELLDALDEAFLEYYDGTIDTLPLVFTKTLSIAYYKKNPMSEKQKDVYYLRKILINRLNYVNKPKSYVVIKNALESGWDYEEVRNICVTCRNWTDFQRRLGVLA